MANKKNNMIDAFRKSLPEIGEVVLKKSDDSKTYVVENVVPGTQLVSIKRQDYPWNTSETVPVDMLIRKVAEERIGVNPFQYPENSQWSRSVTITQSSVGELIRMLKENAASECPKELNFEPFVETENGERRSYQRPYVWTLENEQALIDSIYLDRNCGLICFRRRDFDWIEKNKHIPGVAYTDVVDGKQRLHTLERFINDEFTDSYGNYYSDFSVVAQRQFKMANVFSVAWLKEEATDKDALDAFLNINFAGCEMSKEHIDFVRSLRK